MYVLCTNIRHIHKEEQMSTEQSAQSKVYVITANEEQYKIIATTIGVIERKSPSKTAVFHKRPSEIPSVELSDKLIFFTQEITGIGMNEKEIYLAAEKDADTLNTLLQHYGTISTKNILVMHDSEILPPYAKKNSTRNI